MANAAVTAATSRHAHGITIAVIHPVPLPYCRAGSTFATIAIAVAELSLGWSRF
jgi:hypothetical protein